MLREVEAETRGERNAMYQTRRGEITGMGLLTVAESVADAFIQRGQLILHERALEEVIARAMAGDDEPITDRRILDKFVEQLSHPGYI